MCIRDSDELFELIGTLKATGLPVLYVSHRLDEIPRICDRVEVLRDGKNVGGLNHEDSVPAKIIPLLVGRQLGNLFPDLPHVTEDVVFRADGVSGSNVRNVSLTIHGGEIVGLTGAIGMGQRDFARIVFGAESGTGTMELLGRPLRHGRPDLAVRAGVGYVSGDRKKDGLFPILPVWRNTTVVKSEDLSTGGFLIPAREKKVGVEPVSYTHLDVYKRQSYGGAPDDRGQECEQTGTARPRGGRGGASPHRNPQSHRPGGTCRRVCRALLSSRSVQLRRCDAVSYTHLDVYKRQAFALYLGGVETTAGQMSTLFEQLGKHPEQLKAIHDDPSLIQRAVEESLRYRTIFQVTARTTSRAVEVLSLIHI